MTKARAPEPRVRDLLLREQILCDPESGWEEFLQVHGPRIERILSRFDLSNEDREEVFQEVCQTLSKNNSKALAKWDPRLSTLETYLTVIVVNQARNFLKSSFHLQTTRKVSDCGEDGWIESLVERLETPARSVRDRIEESETIEALESILRRLVEDEKIHPKDRSIFLLRLHGISNKRIACLLEVEPSTVSSRISRLKRTLRNALNSSGIEWEI
jgi:RNA polymerase sigma factor (sigma-70 family)